jgi:hypothetical protein
MVPGPPVTIGCAVLVSPGPAGVPDSGTIAMVLPGGPTANGLPLAMLGSICTMINSITGVPYTLPIGPVAPSQVRLNGQPLVRIGDAIPSGPGVMTILGPPVAPFIMDRTA